MILSRLHSIEEAVRSRPREIEWVLVDAGRRERRIAELTRLCRETGVPLRRGDRAALARLAADNQGAVARVAVRGYLPEEEAFQGEAGSRFLLVLDGVEDPQNLGAVLRVAEGVGAAVAVPERGSAPLSEAVSRSSAGAVERVRVRPDRQCPPLPGTPEGERVPGDRPRVGRDRSLPRGPDRRSGAGPGVRG